MKNQEMNELRTIFKDRNIAESRHWSLEDAMATCHKAFEHMDTYNRARVVEHFPFVAQAARYYGLHMNACNTFEHDNIEMPEDIDAEFLTVAREILDNV